MFIFLLTYQKPLEDVEKYLAAHRMYLDKYYKENKFIVSGRQEPRTGGVIICRAANKEEAKKIVGEDPFFINEIATYQIIEFEPSKCAAGFESYT